MKAPLVVHRADGRLVPSHVAGADLFAVLRRDGAFLGIVETESWRTSPPTIADGALALTGAIRCHDLDRLRGELDSPARTTSALLIEAYRRWGLDFATHIVGDFALFLWDPQTSRLVIARDPLGIAPLYFSRSADQLVCSPHLPLVLRLCASASPNPSAITRYLCSDFEDQRSTVYREVNRLEAGCLGVFEMRERQFHVRRYWEVATAGRHKSTMARATLTEASDELGRALAVAVEDQLAGSERAGATLSGGLDSSSLVALARRLGNRPLPALTVYYQHPAADEQRYVDAVVGQGGIDHQRIDGEALSLLSPIDHFVENHAEPPAPLSPAFHYALCRRAQRVGCDRLLDGFDADAVLSFGQLVIAALARRGDVSLALDESIAWARRQHRPLWRALYACLLKPLIWGVRNTEAINVTGRAMLRPSVRRRMAARPITRLRNEQDVHHRLLARGWRAATLETFYAVSQGLGIDLCFPFFDKRVVELGLSLPPELKYRDGLTKPLLREAMRAWLPPVVLQRTKRSTYGPALADSLHRQGLRALADCAKHPPSIIASYIVDKSAEDCFDRFEKYRQPTDASLLLRLYSLGRWERSQINRRRP